MRKNLLTIFAIIMVFNVVFSYNPKIKASGFFKAFMMLNKLKSFTGRIKHDTNKLPQIAYQSPYINYGSIDNAISPIPKHMQNRAIKKSKLLVLLAEFGTDSFGTGPLHNQIVKPGKSSKLRLWINDFCKEHYEKMLFNKNRYTVLDHNRNILRLETMRDYFMTQSGGNYEIDGDVYGWFVLPHSEAYYGNDDASGTGTGSVDNNLPGTPHDLVADLLKASIGIVPFEDYDIEDPNDMDGDGNRNEPDGVIDHFIIVHAGADQCFSGGAQGSNAIWAHSSSVNLSVPALEGNKTVKNYTMQGEDATIGTFCHEFAHSLGLIDEYNTASNGKTTGTNTLMGTGSWKGMPLGTKPASIGPYGQKKIGLFLGHIWQ